MSSVEKTVEARKEGPYGHDTLPRLRGEIFRYLPPLSLLRGGRGAAPGGADPAQCAAAAAASARHQQPSLLSPLLILLILILAALLVYLLFGDKLAQTLFGESASQQVEETLDGQGDDVTMPEVDGVEDPDQETGTEITDPSQVDPTTLPETLTIAYLGSPREEFTMTVGDDPIPLTASGGTGTYAWSSSDDGIASVDAEGKVTAISAGQATLTVTDGTGKGTCEVIVKAGASNGTSSGGSSTGTSTGTSAGTLKAGPAVVVNGGNGVRVRSGPSTNDEILATIPQRRVRGSGGERW